MSAPGPLAVAVLAREDAPWLGRWRTLPGHEACEAEDRVWVRGPAGPAWALLPALARFSQDEAGRLVPAGATLPRRRAPEGHWLPLAQFLRVQPPAASLPAQSVAPVSWVLEPSSHYRPPALLVAAAAAWRAWVLEAPEARLQPLRFAASGDGRVCVAGSPLPPLAGEWWSVEEGVATPAGWALPAGITPALVAEGLQRLKEELLLLHPDATVERLPAAAFVPACRSAARALSSNLGHPG